MVDAAAGGTMTRDSAEQWSQSWRLFLPIALIAGIGIGLAFLAYSLQRADVQHQAETETQAAVDAAATTIGESFAGLSATLLSVAAVFDAVGNPTEAQFHRFTATALGANPEIRAIQYSEAVTRDQRPAFERELRAAGHPNPILDPTPDGLVPAAERAEYIAIRFNAPAVGNKQVYGLDVVFRPQTRTVVDIARDSGTPQTGPRITLAQGDGTQHAITLYAPLYGTGPTPQTRQERRERFTGLIGIVVLLDAVGDPVIGSDADLALVDPGAYGAPAEVLWSSSGAVGATVEEVAKWPVVETVRTPGRQLYLFGRPSAQLLAAANPLRPWAWAIGVLLVMLLLTSLVWKWMDARRLRMIAGELDRASARLGFLAERDPLTGLPHRRSLQRWYEARSQEEEADARFVLLAVNLDGFKDINTAWGRKTGDTILCWIADGLTTELTTDNSLAARGSSDEFLVMAQLPPDESTEEGVERLAASVKGAVERPVLVDGREFLLTASIGAVSAPGQGRSLDLLLSRADMAVRRAKRESRASVCLYDPDMSHLVLARHRLTTALRRAALEPDANFALLYQPQVDLESGRIVGLEALLRWREGDEDWAAPDVFIPLAEEVGLMPLLGGWVLRSACEQVAQWTAQGVMVPRLAVNVSGRQLLGGRFLTLLAEAMSESGLADPYRLEIEITEATAMGTAELEQLEQVRALGVEIAIDDFGTGFSSLARLTEVPAQRLKIDRRFVAEMTASTEALEVVRAVVRLADALNMQAVAEGVEEAAQVQILAQEGVRIAQGFLYFRPLPPQEVPRVLQSGTPAVQWTGAPSG